MRRNDLDPFPAPAEETTEPVVQSPASMEMDPAEYMPDLDGLDLADAEKIELLQTLWNIMRTFVEIGVEVGKADPCGCVFRVAGRTSGTDRTGSASTGDRETDEIGTEVSKEEPE